MYMMMCVDPRKPGETDRAISILSNCISEIISAAGLVFMFFIFSMGLIFDSFWL